MMKIKEVTMNIIIVLGSILLSLILHGLTQAFSTMPTDAEWSILVRVLGFEITVLIWYIIAFGSITIIYYSLRRTIAQYKWGGGLRYARQ